MMFVSRRNLRLALSCTTAAAGLICFGALAQPAFAQTDDQISVNLVNLLVKQGVITRDAGAKLLKEASAPAATPTRAPTPPAPATLPAPANGATRVQYVPPSVKDEIRADLKKEVIDQAKAENWAQPNEIPAWTKRITISGDLRFRNEWDLYNKANDPELINFAAINANGPVDLNPNTNPGGIPFVNDTKNRYNQLSVRARLDIAADVSRWVSADLRLGTGQTNTPVSMTQILGGGLTKKTIWLDRAYIHLQPTDWVGASFGRMPNPFFSTDMIYDTDLNFDGAASSASWQPFRDVGFKATAGAFLTDTLNPNFPDNSPNKSANEMKWMFAGQLVTNWTTDRFNWKFGAAYYQFTNNGGLLSDPCPVYTGVSQCSTDWSRPAFMQKGNTLFLIRNLVFDPNAGLGLAPAPQFAGLLFPYHILDLNDEFDMPFENGRHLVLTGDYARNLAYSHNAACRYGTAGLPVTNVITQNGSSNTDPCTPATDQASFKSGPNAFMVQGMYGDRDPFRWGEWNFTAGYKHIAPDALIDAYTDADFHLGGTNAKGYYLIATVGLLEGANIQARWFSADEVYGSPMAIDVGQLDLNVRF